jgi:hypothetical protein
MEVASASRDIGPRNRKVGASRQLRLRSGARSGYRHYVKDDCAESPKDGRLISRYPYLRHCASCLGIAGEGDEPLDSSQLTPLADLTQIAERSGGSFDEAEVMASIDGRALTDCLRSIQRESE